MIRFGDVPQPPRLDEDPIPSPVGGPHRVTTVDQRNDDLFAPLLYQVATAALSPADIAVPILRVIARYSNVKTVLGEVGVLTAPPAG